MVESINWTQLKPTDVVEFEGGSYWLTMRKSEEPLTMRRIIDWSSHDAAIAQSYLSAVAGHARKMDLRTAKGEDLVKALKSKL